MSAPTAEQAVTEAKARMAKRYGVNIDGLENGQSWDAINAAARKAAAEYVLPTGPTTVVFGRGGGRVGEIMEERGVPHLLAQSFTGGYDDYDGAMVWAEVPGVVDGPVRRFCPNPGRWMSGVRV